MNPGLRLFYLRTVEALLLVFASDAASAAEPNQTVPADESDGLIAELRGRLEDGAYIDKRKAKEQAEVKALIAIIDEESKRGGDDRLKHRALRELEKFPNSNEGVAILLREIQFEPPQLSSKNPLATYTAADVLSKMGPHARSKILRGLLKPLSEPELYLRSVVLVNMDRDEAAQDLGKEFVLRRLRHQLELVENEKVPPGEPTEFKAATLFNLKRMISQIEDPKFSPRRVPEP